MFHFKNFYSEIGPINSPKDDTKKQSIRSLIRFGDKPSVVIVEPDDEETENSGGSIEGTPENPTISDTKDINTQDQIEMNILRERWTKISGITK